MRGVLRGICVAFSEGGHIGLRTQDGSYYKFVGIETVGSQGILEITADKVQQLFCRWHQIRNGMGKLPDLIKVTVLQKNQFIFHLFRLFPILHWRHAYGLGHVKLDIVHVVELTGILHIIDAHRVVLNGAKSQPALFADAAADRKKRI